MLRLFISVIIFTSLLAVQAASEIYRYKDKEGVTRFTNDISKVPEDLRDRAEEIEEIKSPPATPSQTPAETEPEEPSSTDSAEASDEEKAMSDEEAALEKKELEEEYKALIDEKTQIDADTKKWQIWYNTRKRKQVARGHLNKLKKQQAEWEVKYEIYEKKKKDFERLSNAGNVDNQ